MMAEDMRRAQLLQTKCNYVSCLRGYWGYCAERGVDPYSNEITPSVAIFWYYSRCRRLGSCNSWKTWESALDFWSGAIGAGQEWKHDMFYKKMKKNMLKLYKKK
eukprot:46310_1